jgi:hypothetical protein
MVADAGLKCLGGAVVDIGGWKAKKGVWGVPSKGFSDLDLILHSWGELFYFNSSLSLKNVVPPPPPIKMGFYPILMVT